MEAYDYIEICRLNRGYLLFNRKWWQIIAELAVFLKS
jgi:hypothetical protein